MENEYMDLDLDFENFKSEPPEDILINKIKNLSEKHNISFIEALEVVKHLESEIGYLENIKDALYEIDRSIMSLENATCK